MTSFEGKGFTFEDSNLSFESFLLGIASSALIYLGEAPHPESNKLTKDLNAAKQNIDILELLELKTRGNLTPAEQKLINTLLTDLRIKFVRHTGT